MNRYFKHLFRVKLVPYYVVAVALAVLVTTVVLVESNGNTSKIATSDHTNTHHDRDNTTTTSTKVTLGSTTSTASTTTEPPTTTMQPQSWRLIGTVPSSMINISQGYTGLGSCPTTSFCIKVGNQDYYIEYVNSTWEKVNEVNPAGQPVTLTEISCTSAPFCMAVDGDGNSYIVSDKNINV